MPKCKNCNNRIDRFNKDRCPICGVTFPFEGMNSDTVEITTNIDVDSVDQEYYRPCRKKELFLFFCLLGIFGAPYFYIRKAKEGIIQLITNVVIIALMSFLLWYFTILGIGYAILISIGSMYLLNIIFGAVVVSQPNLKDGKGQFIV